LSFQDHLLASKRRIDEKQDRIKQKNMKKFAKQVCGGAITILEDLCIDG
jgi:hypothetical protein